MSVYEQLQKQYLGKEIKMIPYKYLQQYITFGFKCLYEWTENFSNNEKEKYCFIIEV